MEVRARYCHHPGRGVARAVASGLPGSGAAVPADSPGGSLQHDGGLSNLRRGLDPGGALRVRAADRRPPWRIAGGHPARAIGHVPRRGSHDRSLDPGAVRVHGRGRIPDRAHTASLRNADDRRLVRRPARWACRDPRIPPRGDGQSHHRPRVVGEGSRVCRVPPGSQAVRLRYAPSVQALRRGPDSHPQSPDGRLGGERDRRCGVLGSG